MKMRVLLAREEGGLEPRKRAKRSHSVDSNQLLPDGDAASPSGTSQSSGSTGDENCGEEPRLDSHGRASESGGRVGSTPKSAGADGQRSELGSCSPRRTPSGRRSHPGRAGRELGRNKRARLREQAPSVERQGHREGDGRKGEGPRRKGQRKERPEVEQQNVLGSSPR